MFIDIIQTHLKSLPFADIVVFLALIVVFGIMIAYSFADEVEELHEEDIDETNRIETLTSGSIGEVFNHTAFDEEEDK